MLVVFQQWHCQPCNGNVPFNSCMLSKSVFDDDDMVVGSPAGDDNNTELISVDDVVDTFIFIPLDMAPTEPWQHCPINSTQQIYRQIT